MTYDGLTGHEFMRIVGDDVDKWTDAGLEAAARHGMTVEREWLRSLLSDAMDAARRLNMPVVVSFAEKSLQDLHDASRDAVANWEAARDAAAKERNP